MVTHTIETEVQPEGLIQVRVPEAQEGRKVRVTIEEIAAAGESELDVRLKELRGAYAEGEITQPQYSARLVDLLESYDDGPVKRVLGRWKGKIHILPGFDDPIEGLEWAYE